MTACIASPLRTPMKTLRFDKYTFDMLVDRPSPTLYIDYIILDDLGSICVIVKNYIDTFSLYSRLSKVCISFLRLSFSLNPEDRK